MMHFIFAIKKIEAKFIKAPLVVTENVCVLISEYLTRLNIRYDLLKGACQGTVTLNHHSLLYLVFTHTELT